MCFLKGVRRLTPVFKPSVPSWDLALVLEALCGPPFKPIESADLKCISYKPALLLALTSAKRVGDLHALSVHLSCTQFTPDGSKMFCSLKERTLHGCWAAVKSSYQTDACQGSDLYGPFSRYSMRLTGFQVPFIHKFWWW